MVTETERARAILAKADATLERVRNRPQNRPSWSVRDPEEPEFTREAQAVIDRSAAVRAAVEEERSRLIRLYATKSDVRNAVLAGARGVAKGVGESLRSVDDRMAELERGVEELKQRQWDAPLRALPVK